MIHIAPVVRQALRSADLLFRFGSSELIVFLSNASSETAAQIVQRIADRLRDNRLSVQERQTGHFGLRVGIATSPSDGTTIDNLVSAAEQRARSLDEFLSGPRSIRTGPQNAIRAARAGRFTETIRALDVHDHGGLEAAILRLETDML